MAALLITSTLLLAESYDIINALPYRYIGPDGNRIIAVIGEPGNPKVIYAGAASGGIFKSTDGGIYWDPIFDDQDVSSVNALAMAPSDPNVIWAGTGETFIRSNISLGNGIYKSTDAGKTWKHMGLRETGRISRIVIHPTNPDIVLAAAMGHCYGPQQERGVFRTTDGGETWERTLFVDEDTGASDLAMDPSNPRNLVAGMWPLTIKTYLRTSGGPGGGLFKSTDSGATWKRLEKGLPEPPTGKIAVAYAPSNPDRVYALIENEAFAFKGVLWSSDDGGDSWNLVSYDTQYHERAHYYSRLGVAVDNDDEVWFVATRAWRTQDGGKTAVMVPQMGGDNHDIWFDPEIPDRIIVGNDGGVALSINRGETWHRPELPTGQMYHVAVDDRIPYFVYGNRQDGPSTRGPSNSLSREIAVGMWHAVGGGESGFSYPLPSDNNIVWSASYDGVLTRYDLRTGHARTVDVWPDDPMGWGPAELKYRFNWTFPILISPHHQERVYVGSQVIHVTEDQGHSWKVISPDLTLNTKETQTGSGGLTEDNIGVDFGNTLFALAESPLQEGVIWAGSNDGLVHVTRDGGQEWTNVTKNIPDLPEWGTISNIEPSRFDLGTAYISVDFHQMNNRDPYAYKTTDFGRTWHSVVGDIPKSVLSYVHVIREDPERKGLLYLGTENALFVSVNDGENWIHLRSNMPPAPVHWLTIQEHFSDLVVATYGRGFYILDDITPLRELDSRVLASDVHLFEPRPAYRFQNVSLPGYGGGERSEATGQNPPYGASITYYLKEEPKGHVHVTILDDTGEEIRFMEGTTKKGINRVYWDLRHGRAVNAKVRTPPLGHPGVEYGPEMLRYGAKGWRPIITFGNKSGLGAAGPRVVPGTFTVKLEVGGKTLSTSLEVRKDPNTTGTVDDIRKQVALALEIQDTISETAKMINGIEWLRKQIDDMEQMHRGNREIPHILEAASELDQKAIEVEKNFYQLTLTGATNDNLRGPTMFYSKLHILSRGLQRGDFPPTTQQVEVHELYKEMLGEYQGMYDNLMQNELPVFNDLLRENDLQHITIPRNQ
jgi:photosystem II stability/assembly factor-like uncharacterized protein